MLSLTALRPWVRLVPAVVSPEVAARPFAAALMATSLREILVASTLLAAATVPVGAFLFVLFTAALG